MTNEQAAIDQHIETSPNDLKEFGWVILEVMGHRTRVGRAFEENVAGGVMLRIDIPASVSTRRSHRRRLRRTGLLMAVILTRHGTKRVRQRLGVPMKAVEKLANDAFDHGAAPEAFSGRLRRYLDWIRKNRAETDLPTLRVRHRHVFIFKDNHLITAWLLPADLKNTKAVK
ncbi:hypothetical protein [Hoeflea poritis]|uniref:Uncharacterized protein n=1 Tax=Hoeflea poritis TaxID=2993659 RepID=A0ABT4VPQ4_9HYPH|nr:hypothetical protein [Hoeflea poritis]MDA4845993.1 hypothetical protein [Hoeflea poritis]